MMSVFDDMVPYQEISVELDDDAIMPKRVYSTDAGLDLFAREDFVVPAHGYAFHKTGVHVQIPKGTDGHVRSKSGLNRFHGITADGTIDEGYTDSIGVTLHNSGDDDYQFRRGDKIAQLVIEIIVRPKPVQVDRISGGERGDNGFGSTGR
jgi:dUTP pyrophosphatase